MYFLLPWKRRAYDFWFISTFKNSLRWKEICQIPNPWTNVKCSKKIFLFIPFLHRRHEVFHTCQIFCSFRNGSWRKEICQIFSFALLISLIFIFAVWKGTINFIIFSIRKFKQFKQLLFKFAIAHNCFGEGLKNVCVFISNSTLPC